MDVGDDVVTAGVSAAAALLGAWIGARATRRASVDALNQAQAREDETWRVALHQECLLNIRLEDDNAASLILLETSVLRASTAHARAFPAEVLQRIIWARSKNEQFEAGCRAYENNPTTAIDPVERALPLLVKRKDVVADLSEIEKQLRPLVPPMAGSDAAGSTRWHGRFRRAKAL